jgi:hypothetical protein
MGSYAMAYTKFHDNRFRNSGYIKGITSTTATAVVSVLLMRGILKYTVKLVLGGMIYIPNLITIGAGIRIILRYYRNSLRGCSVGYY